jgi:hypothetical protein
MQAMSRPGTELVSSLLTQEKTSLRDALGFLPWGEALLASIAEILSGLNR